MYAAIDALADKLDRQVLRHKEKKNGQRHEPAAIKRTASAPVPGKARPH
jgi:putative sigma-54 modulation protein